MSRSLESVLGGAQDQDIGNAAQSGHRRRLQSQLPPDPRRFSDAVVNPPPRPPPPNLKRIKPLIFTDRRNPLAGAWTPPPHHLQLQFQHQPLQQCFGSNNLARMAHLAKSSPQLDDDLEKEKERDKEREREKGQERYPPQVNKEAVIAQVCIFHLYVYKPCIQFITIEEFGFTVC